MLRHVGNERISVDEMLVELDRIYKTWRREIYRSLAKELNERKFGHSFEQNISLLLSVYFGIMIEGGSLTDSTMGKIYGLERRDIEKVLEYFEVYVLGGYLAGVSTEVVPFRYINQTLTVNVDFTDLWRKYQYYHEHRDKKKDWDVFSRLADRKGLKKFVYMFCKITR